VVDFDLGLIDYHHQFALWWCCFPLLPKFPDFVKLHKTKAPNNKGFIKDS
jgi:hypothetical protein